MAQAFVYLLKVGTLWPFVSLFFLTSIWIPKPWWILLLNITQSRPLISALPTTAFTLNLGLVPKYGDNPLESLLASTRSLFYPITIIFHTASHLKYTCYYFSLLCKETTIRTATTNQATNQYHLLGGPQLPIRWTPA